MTLGIVTDSTCDLPAAMVEENGIEVVPSILVVDGTEYVDGTGMTREEYYARLPGLTSRASTASSSIHEYASRYEALLARGCEHVLSIHAPAGLTSITDTARQAARAFGERITCIDSGSLSLGLGFQVLAAAESTELGLRAALTAVESVRRRVRVFAALDTLEYVKRSGRVSKAVATLGGLLSIKPLIELSEGEVKAVGAVRTTRQADEKILDILLARGKLERLAVLHTNAETRARHLLNRLMEKASQSAPRDILMVNVTTVIGTHVGPNGLGFAAVTQGAG